ncbi:MAG TPA: SulP family inorganic anion transporter [Candidatus Acidoferrum sp.]|nr:SulP family inorganic anion transporter [Candidatus Acidoferrum sp.]
MAGSKSISKISLIGYLGKVAPGLPKLLTYQRRNLSHDFVAGLSVAAVALPVGVAYAQLAGFNPAVGLYSSILPLLAYAIFGTSRQLIIGPDAATIPGLILLRFNAPLVFFNAPYFKRGVMAAADAAGPSLKWLVLDMLPITLVDSTGLYTAEEVADVLREWGVLLAAAGRQTEWHLWAESWKRPSSDRKIRFYPTFREVIRAYQSVEALRSESS